ncbi:MAG: Heparinase family protein, partial [Gemmatimonadetes bacterium]|nr:Heparinase family protein [Gemmatimonadota bacterium]
RHVHRRTDIGWRVETADRLGARRSVDLAGPRAPSIGPSSPLLDELPLDVELDEVAPPLALPLLARLGEPHYRQSEASWAEAGSPAAEVTVSRAGDTLAIDVRVEPSGRRFVPPGTENVLDNEPAGINGDGVQVYVAAGEATGGWLFVPVASRNEVRVRPVEGWDGGLVAEPRWHAIEHGYAMHVEVALPPGLDVVSADVVVNEIGEGRARRRGQLILSGGAGEFVYLRGDRHESGRLLRFSLADA